MYSKINRVLGPFGSALRTSRVSYARWSTRQKLTVRNEFLFNFCFLRLGFPSTCNALKGKMCRMASDGNAFDWTTYGCSLHGQDARAAARAFSLRVESVETQLFRLCFGFTGTLDYLLPKPMGKHDPLMTVVRHSGPRGSRCTGFSFQQDFERQPLLRALPRS